VTFLILTQEIAEQKLLLSDSLFWTQRLALWKLIT